MKVEVKIGYMEVIGGCEDFIHFVFATIELWDKITPVISLTENTEELFSIIYSHPEIFKVNILKKQKLIF